MASALAASDAGWGDARNAQWHGVSVKTIRRWRRDYQRRGLPRGQGHTNAHCPRCSDARLATQEYTELLGWYLGDGHITRSKSGVYNLHVYNDRAYPLDNDRIMALMRAVKPGGRPHSRLLPGCIVVTVGWNHWPCLFPQHGPGRKHERTLGMAHWQWDLVEKHPADFLRGLFHSDGSRSRNWASREVRGEVKRYEYPRWEFSNRSEEILTWCGQALDLAGVAWRRSSRHHVAVSRRTDVARLDDLIGLKQ